MTFRKFVGEEDRWQIVKFNNKGQKSTLKAKDEAEARRKFESNRYGNVSRLVLQKVRYRHYDEMDVPDGGIKRQVTSKNVDKVSVWSRGSA